MNAPFRTRQRRHPDRFVTDSLLVSTNNFLSHHQTYLLGTFTCCFFLSSNQLLLRSSPGLAGADPLCALYRGNIRYEGRVCTYRT